MRKRSGKASPKKVSQKDLSIKKQLKKQLQKKYPGEYLTWHNGSLCRVLLVGQWGTRITTKPSGKGFAPALLLGIWRDEEFQFMAENIGEWGTGSLTPMFPSNVRSYYRY